MGFHGGGYRVFLHGGLDENQAPPRLSWTLIRRILGYAQPFRRLIAVSFVTVLITEALSLLQPLIFRDLIDNALPNRDADRLNLLALGLVTIPIINALIGVLERWINSTIGEGVIYRLRVALYGHLQRMSLRFFTNSKTGELMSRLNNDVVDAQNVISNSFVDIITNLITVFATLGVMLALEWRLTVLGLVVFPVFVLIARRVGSRLRVIARQAMDYNAEMNAMMNETLNISGALLVKLFGRWRDEVARFEDRAAKVRDIGVRRAVLGSQFFGAISMVSVIGTALVYWVGGHLVLNDVFTVGTIVAFSAYLTRLYGPLQSLTNAPVQLATSMVSFERVFEIIDLPVEIGEKPNAVTLSEVRGEITFDRVGFDYVTTGNGLLSEVTRHGRMDNVRAVLSLADKPAPESASGKPPLPADEAALVPFSKTYSQAREAALDDISFTIQPGQLAALVGPSGAGKTTLTYLIPRLYDPSRGRILLDGH
ncbi:ABC transporter ATP-binding protein, partial [Anaerolineae bacterium CFX9]|nr:ABC transporter ATP-binding protein [Anaerolineae bacterium CFX9]